MKPRFIPHTTYHILHTKIRDFFITYSIFFIFLLDRYLKDFSIISKTINPGISFSLSFPNVVYFIVSIILICVFLFLFLQIPHSKFRPTLIKYKLPILLILTGGFSNLIDRVIYGGVVDYINFFGVLYNNLSDFLIIVGLLFVAIKTFNNKTY